MLYSIRRTLILRYKNKFTRNKTLLTYNLWLQLVSFTKGNRTKQRRPLWHWTLNTTAQAHNASNLTTFYSQPIFIEYSHLANCRVFSDFFSICSLNTFYQRFPDPDPCIQFQSLERTLGFVSLRLGGEGAGANFSEESRAWVSFNMYLTLSSVLKIG